MQISKSKAWILIGVFCYLTGYGIWTSFKCYALDYENQYLRHCLGWESKNE